MGKIKDMNNDNGFKLGAAVAVIVVIIMCVVSAYSSIHSEKTYRAKFEQEAVQKGHGFYNPTNGLFQWK